MFEDIHYVIKHRNHSNIMESSTNNYTQSKNICICTVYSNQAYYYDHREVIRITQIISYSWYLLVGEYIGSK